MGTTRTSQNLRCRLPDVVFDVGQAGGSLVRQGGKEAIAMIDRTRSNRVGILGKRNSADHN